MWQIVDIAGRCIDENYFAIGCDAIALVHMPKDMILWFDT